VIALPEAAAARGALFWSQRIVSDAEALPFVTRLPAGEVAPPTARPRMPSADQPLVPPGRDEAKPARRESPPTHLLHAGRAWPIDNEPFLLGTSIPEGRRGLNLTGATAGISRSHCRVYERDGRVVVEDSSSYGTWLNGDRIDGSALLAAGDRLRLGAPGIEIQLISVVRDDETPPLG
jgi:hypothetical protein